MRFYCHTQPMLEHNLNIDSVSVSVCLSVGPAPSFRETLVLTQN